MGETLGMIDVLGECEHPRAEPALAIWVLFVTLHLG
jgi:hypothetical protein